MATIEQLKHLIDLTHKHGVELKAQIQHLRNTKPRGWVRQVALKTAHLRGLELLNRKRRVELAIKEHKPIPKPPPRPRPTQRFTMYDTTEVFTHLPTPHPQAVAGYVGGSWPTYNGLVRHYPHAKHLSIAVNASENAHCLDVEQGDATPGQAPGWVRRQHARGIKRPIIYCGASNRGQVESALRNDSIHRNEYMLWVAHWTGVPHIEPGSDATQWRAVEQPGRNYDISLCEPWFL